MQCEPGTRAKPSPATSPGGAIWATACGMLTDERSGGTNDEPEAAVLVHVLAAHLARALVRVVVERPAVVCELQASVAPSRLADQRLSYSCAGSYYRAAS